MVYPYNGSSLINKTKTLTIHAATWIDGVGIIMRRNARHAYASIYVNWDKMCVLMLSFSLGNEIILSWKKAPIVEARGRGGMRWGGGNGDSVCSL